MEYAVKLLTDAVQLEKAEKYPEALTWFVSCLFAASCDHYHELREHHITYNMFNLNVLLVFVDFHKVILCSYMQGIEALMRQTQVEPQGPRRVAMEEKISGYLKKAESLKQRIEQDTKLTAGQTQRRHEKTISIDDNATGFRFFHDRH